MGLLDRFGRDGDEDRSLIRALNAAADHRTPDNVKQLVAALGDADAFLLSAGGTPMAPNARTLTRNGRTWTVAFSSAARAIAANRANDGILRAPMPLVCTVAAKSGQAGVFLNPGSAPWMLIEGGILTAVAAIKGPNHPITMVSATHPVSLLVEVTPDGGIRVDGVPRSLAELREDLQALRERHGVVQYTRANPGREPDDATWSAARAALDAIAELGLPVTFVERIQPDDAAGRRPG